MSRLTRRQFLAGTLATGAVYAAGGQPAGARAARTMTDQVPLGRTGIRVSRLAFGTGTKGWEQQSNQTRLGGEAFGRLLRHAYARGITYFDAADIYGTHRYLRQALKGFPRASYVLSSKCWYRTTQGIQADLDRFLREVGSDYLDMMHLHAVTDATWPTDLRPLMEVLETAKQQGRIRAHGLSIHSLEAMQAAAACDWVDVAVCRVNHVGEKMDASPDQVVPVVRHLHQAGKGVVAIKLLGEGTIAAQRQDSLRFVLGLGCVDSLVIGFESTAQVDDLVKLGNRILAG